MGGARRGALFDTVEDTGTKEPSFRVGEFYIEVAGSELKYFLHFYEDMAKIFCSGEWAE